MRRLGLGRVQAGCAFAAMLAAQIVAGQAPVSSPVPPDSEIRKILADRVDTYRQSVGIVVGVIEPQGRRFIAYGNLDQGDPRPLKGDTIFEIGSITKVFTSLLLSDMVQRGEVALAGPHFQVPARRGQGASTKWKADHASGSCDPYLFAIRAGTRMEVRKIFDFVVYRWRFRAT
jgi:serine-type D-Ala-D-Ala carboxypeptidase/endopeptidase